jgi:prepilin-type N-terminal cleavage/methylation domain-containing protein
MSNTYTNERGFGLAELSVVVAVMGVLTLLAVPNVVSYWRSAKVSAGAEELAAVLNRARHLAVRQNTWVCVQRSGTNVRLRTGASNCTGTIWAGVGTDSAGVIALTNTLQISGDADAVFTNAGGASTIARYTVTDPQTGRARDVFVTSTGRVNIQ